MAIGMLLDMAESANPDRVAIGPRAGGWSYLDLAARATAGAARIAAAGAGSLAFVGVNGPEFPAAVFAAARAGVPVAPLNYRLSADALGELLERLPSPLVLADDAFAMSLAAPGRTVLSTSDWLMGRTAGGGADLREAADEEPAVLLFTSGTTAAPKCVVLRHENLLSYVLSTVDFGSAQETDAALISVPPYHIAGVGTVLTNVYAGRRMLYLPSFTSAGWLDLVRAEGVTSAMVVPTMLARVVDDLAGADAGVPSLRSLAYGGARMPQPVLERALAAFPDTGFVNAYGLTETSSTIAVLDPQDHRDALASDDPLVRARLSSAGRMVPGVEGEIRDPAGAVLPPGEPGELWVRGGQVSGEYLGSGSVLDDEGWFPTRDRAWLDADGYLFIEGRSDDTIIRGGENVAPAEVEDVLLRHPAVAEAAVVGLPDDEWGERIVAVVVAATPTPPEVAELREWVRAVLRSSRTPDEVVFRDALPYTATGKLLRRQLTAELAAAVRSP
jgi:acyl-CoA synthetase (AMP-forming)/AMP-acid ligase II